MSTRTPHGVPGEQHHRPDPPPQAAWEPLFRVGGLAALGVLLLFPIQMVVYVVAPPPSTVVDWFQLFQRNPLVGLLSMDLLLIVDYILLGLVFLALCAALKHVSPSFTAIALTLELLGLAAYFASTTALEMWSLSNQYAAATSDAERATFLAAGQALLATWQGTAFAVGYILSGVALLLISLVMRQSPAFSKLTAHVGIIAGAAGLVPANAGMVGLVLSLVSLVPLVVWLVLIARRLLQLGARTSREGAIRLPTTEDATP